MEPRASVVTRLPKVNLRGLELINEADSQRYVQFVKPKLVAMLHEIVHFPTDFTFPWSRDCGTLVRILWCPRSLLE